MAVIAVYSVKGGVGKTTIAANLAWCSAATRAARTLLWDLDAAGGAGFLFGVDPRRKHSARKASFSKDADPGRAGPQDRRSPRLDLLPADEFLRELDALLARLGKERRLAKLTEDLGAALRADHPRLPAGAQRDQRASDPRRRLRDRAAAALAAVDPRVRAGDRRDPRPCQGPSADPAGAVDARPRRTLHRLAREEHPGLAGHTAGERGRAMRGAPAAARHVRADLAGGEGLRPVVDRDRAQAGAQAKHKG